MTRAVSSGSRWLLILAIPLAAGCPGSGTSPGDRGPSPQPRKTGLFPMGFVCSVGIPTLCVLGDLSVGNPLHQDREGSEGHDTRYH